MRHWCAPVDSIVVPLIAHTAVSCSTLHRIVHTGSLSYVPVVKAVQEFHADGTIANGVYAWNVPLIRFTGQFKWSEASSRLTFGFDQCKVHTQVTVTHASADVT
jgi:hypothetical protein